jgi:hypothetical protein
MLGVRHIFFQHALNSRAINAIADSQDPERLFNKIRAGQFTACQPSACLHPVQSHADLNWRFRIIMGIRLHVYTPRPRETGALAANGMRTQALLYQAKRTALFAQADGYKSISEKRLCP